VRELGLHLAGALVDRQERLVDDPHEHRVVTATTTTTPVRLGNEPGEVVHRGVAQDRLDPLER